MRGVYFIQMAQFVKIGYSLNIEKRLKGLQTAMPLTPVLLGVIQGVSVSRERQLHRKFAGARKQGEWFELNDKILVFIAKHTTHKCEKVIEINETLVENEHKVGKKKPRKRGRRCYQGFLMVN